VPNLRVAVIGNAMVGGVVKGVQRDFSLAGVWGCPPAFKKSPKIGGYRGLIENISAVSYSS
jgi:hypothetical protein